MKINKKIIVAITIILILVIVSIIIGVILPKEETTGIKPNKIKENKNEEVIKNQTINGIEITDVSLSFDNNNAWYKGVLENQTKSSVFIKNVEIIIKNNYDLEIVTMYQDINREVKPGEKIDMKSMTSMQLPEDVAYCIDYIVNTK